MAVIKNILIIASFTILATACFQNSGVAKTEMIEKLEKKLGLTFKGEESTFTDYTQNRKFGAEKYSFKVSGEKVKNYIWLISETQTLFSRNRFEEDINYAADGPTGTAFAFTRDGEKYLFEIGWELDETIKLNDEEFSNLDVSSIDPKKVFFHMTIYRIGGE